MQDPHKPDLDDSLNVTQSHERLLRDAAAVAREKRVNDGGREPVSNWIFVTGGVVAIAAGLALGQAGGLFDYDATVAPGYVRRSLDSGEDSGPPPVDALKAYMAKGEKIYSKCVGCHGPDGKGGGAYPSLAGSEWAMGPTERFSMVILNGLTGPTSTGKEFGVMPAQGVGMSPTDLAAVMTYVRNSFGNEKGEVVTQEMAAHAIEISEKRAQVGTPVNKGELDSDHLQDLEGAALDPTTKVDPVSLAPVEE
ncbi:mono/diheme cytochrome c family protein [Haloferula luteola]|uniref:Mono/diheme cytochrome c family protein n=1 Tax=Haloferula luteola TaxID=595692 RepID=A0A840V6B8_9BACT|nr:cytochrome c [Haloferula luteola]MBB5353807.1 mono/diheme cytochrome c family protein [Haloferula luteola]